MSIHQLTGSRAPLGADAYSGTIPPGSHATAANFMTKRSANANYADTGHYSGGDAITGLNMKGGFKTVATSGIAGQHHQYGYNRRVVLVPFSRCPTVPAYIVDFACVLLLQPMTSPTVDVQVEFRASRQILATLASQWIARQHSRSWPIGPGTGPVGEQRGKPGRGVWQSWSSL